MLDANRDLEAFQACLRAPFATLGITTTDKHVTGIRYLASSAPARAPGRGRGEGSGRGHDGALGGAHHPRAAQPDAVGGRDREASQGGGRPGRLAFLDPCTAHMYAAGTCVPRTPHR